MPGMFVNLFYIIVFLFGLIIGSFINCVIYRLHVGKPFWTGRSFCPKCKHKLLWFDNIPILSFLLLKGKCHYCHKKISIQYPIVELLTGIFFLLVFIVDTANFSDISIFLYLHIFILLRDWIFISILIVIFIYDLKYYLILDKVIVPSMAIVLILNIVIHYLQEGDLSKLFYYFIILLFSGIICGGFFLIQFLVSKGKWIGGGDIRLGFLMGLMLGWPDILVALFLAYILGSIIGIILILTKIKTMKSQVPFGTFLTVGTFLSLLFGDLMIEKYLNIF